MTRFRVSDADLVALVGDGGGTWRHTALIAALTHAYGCNPRSARRIVASAIERGVIARTGSVYGTADMASTPCSSLPHRQSRDASRDEASAPNRCRRPRRDTTLPPRRSA